MITKERLQELIEQKATIYSCYYSEFYSNGIIDLSKDHFYIEDDMLFSGNTCWAGNDEHWNLEDLFESKEEADWENELGNIIRTETLRLPTWEEMKSEEEKIICKFLAKDLYWYAIMQFNGKQGWVIYNINKNKIVRKSLKRTKENYTEVCRLAKKLFLGEEEKH